MVLTDVAKTYFASIPSKVRVAHATTRGIVPFFYEDEPFFVAYDALAKRRTKHASRRAVADQLGIGRKRVKELERPKASGSGWIEYCTWGSGAFF
jgi:hypothetical protein